MRQPAVALKMPSDKLAKEHHPDRNDGCEEAAGQFRGNPARPIRGCSATRRSARPTTGSGRHRRRRREQRRGQGFAGVHDMFSRVFGQAFGDMNGARAAPATGKVPRGQDLRFDLEDPASSRACTSADHLARRPGGHGPEPLPGPGVEPGTSPAVRSACSRGGRVRASQGFFSIKAHLPRCGRTWPAGARALPTVTTRPRPGRGASGRTWVASGFGIRDGAQIRPPAGVGPGKRSRPRSDLYICRRSSRASFSARRAGPCSAAMPVPKCCRLLGRRDRGQTSSAARTATASAVKVKGYRESVKYGRTVRRLRGRGVPSLRARSRRHPVVELLVETPTRLNAPAEGAGARGWLPASATSSSIRDPRLLHEGAAVLGRGITRAETKTA